MRESYSNISRKLGVDEETVRMRVNRARERGFLPVWRVMVNPLLFNCREAAVNLEASDEQQHKADTISKIRAVQGVHAIVNFRGREMAVMTYFEKNESMEEKVRMLESICGSPRVALWDNPYIRPDVQMKNLDWRIIDVMHEDAWVDLDLVSKSLGISSRTVQRRLSVLIEGRAVYLLWPPNADVVGRLLCNFLVFCQDPGKKRAADYSIHSNFTRIGASDTSSEHFSTFGISCENYSEADKVLERLKTIDGVTSVRMRIIKEIILVPDWLRNQIAIRF